MPLTLHIKGAEYYDSAQNLFYQIKDQVLILEHSLVSMSKWESTWKVPFLNTEKKTDEQIIDYLKCMTISKNVDPMVYRCLSRADLIRIKNYMDDPMTATTFSSDGNKNGNNKPVKKKKILTTEEIYWQMSALNIPFECDKWHWNRLQTLIRIASIRNSPPKKMGKKEQRIRNKELNEARKLAMHTTG